MPSRINLTIVGESPDRFAVRVHAAEIKDYPVGSDGKVALDVPSLPRACSVYFLNVRVQKGIEPTKEKAIHLVEGQRAVTSLSLEDVSKLPSDAAGYRV